MSLKQYQRQILEWEQKYGKQRHYFANITQIKCACAKCGRITARMSRHHKGSEFVFACFRPDDFAPRYIQFHPDDVVRLCHRCHRLVEKYYEPLKNEMWNEVYVIGGVTNVTKEWCEDWIKLFKERYEKWIKLPLRKRRRKRRVKRRSRKSGQTRSTRIT